MALSATVRMDAGEDRLAGLPGNGFLGSLPREVAEDLVDAAPLVSYPRDRLVLSSLDGSGAAIVVSGMLRHFLSTPDGRQVTIKYVGEGGLIGNLVSCAGGVATNFEAVEPSVLLHVEADRLRSLARKHPELSVQLIEVLTTRLRHAYLAVAASAFSTITARVARDLIERARASGRLQSGDCVQVTQQALADAIGSVREVVARSLRELKRRKLIASQHSCLTILDLKGLAREAGVPLGEL